MTNEYGPWIAYNGGGMPEELRGKKVQLHHRSETQILAESRSATAAKTWDWDISRKYGGAIIAYRVLIEPPAPREKWFAEYDWGLSGVAFDTKQMCEARASGVRGMTFIRAVRFVETPE